MVRRIAAIINLTVEMGTDFIRVMPPIKRMSNEPKNPVIPPARALDKPTSSPTTNIIAATSLSSITATEKTAINISMLKFIAHIIPDC